jgi:hypothetical protein
VIAMKNAMTKNSKANQNIDVWLRQAVTEYLKRDHPAARTWKEKAEAVGIPHSVLYEYLRGGKSIRLQTAAQLIDRIGGDLMLALPGSARQRTGPAATKAKAYSLFVATPDGSLTGNGKLSPEKLSEIWEGLPRADLKGEAFFVEDAQRIILFEPGGHDSANLRLVLARVGAEDTARLVQVQPCWEDRARREALVMPWQGGCARLILKKDIQIEAVAVADFYIN